jgi:threonine synthase
LKYISTRGEAPVLAFDDVLLAGLAADGGLYVPAEWPQFSFDDFAAMAGLSYAQIAFRVIQPFVDGTIADDDLERMIDETYAQFGHAAVAPLKQIGTNDWLMELFHGPTLAFKDFALQLVGRMFAHVLAARGERVTIVGATSGDTGSAAIEACRDRDNIDVFILFPEGRVSSVQQRQMTTVDSANVHAVAIGGTFDDCQDLVKAMFNDSQFRLAQNLSAVNSINWARVMAQIVYYVVAAVRLGAPGRAVSFAVPTGNFGNVLAGWAAWKCGLPIDRLVVGTNSNDILFRFFETGEMKMAAAEPTLSPSMDIQVSSNFERLLFDMLGGDGAAVRQWIDDFRQTGAVSVDDARLAAAREKFVAARLDDAGTRRVIREIYETTGELLDPHSAIGVDAARQCRGDSAVPMIALATAHPAKFPDAVEAATGVHPALPERMAGLFDRVERYDTLANDIGAVQDYVRRTVGAGGVA